MTPYEIWKGKSPNLSFHVLGCICYIRNDKDNLVQLDSKSDEGIFLGYSSTSMAYWVYNKRTHLLGDDVNVIFDDHNSLLLEPVEPPQDENDATNDGSEKCP